CKFLSAGVAGKAGVGVDFIETDHALHRGDGFVGFEVSNSTVKYITQFYEANAFLEAHITEKCRIRAAYNVLWLVGIGVSQDQIDFNLANPQGASNKNGS